MVAGGGVGQQPALTPKPRAVAVSRLPAAPRLQRVPVLAGCRRTAVRGEMNELTLYPLIYFYHLSTYSDTF